MSKAEYRGTPPFRKSPESTCARGKPTVGSQQSNGQALAEFLSVLAKGSRELEASSLRGAEEIEITACDRRTGALLDRACTVRLPELKKLVRRNRQALFTLHVSAKPPMAHRLCAALGAPWLYDSSHSGERLRISIPLTADTQHEITITAEAETYGWHGVTIHFPRDPWQRATLRDALLVLAVRPAARRQPKAHTLRRMAPQLSLPL